MTLRLAALMPLALAGCAAATPLPPASLMAPAASPAAPVMAPKTLTMRDTPATLTEPGDWRDLNDAQSPAGVTR
ncbi:hypothetical protein [Jannaschia sp. M317]|uniref:hypothetical protein n=1 Tax=Jannaschia sp. M317 TaxID=2867011 RepID=UPI0021A7A7C4|nr:hypothetical protein [Jannaschia sp. M317]UWQ19744.1 hypothetical protein K3551_18970 [Jannaschia sp. M317]